MYVCVRKEKERREVSNEKIGCKQRRWLGGRSKGGELAEQLLATAISRDDVLFYLTPTHDRAHTGTVVRRRSIAKFRPAATISEMLCQYCLSPDQSLYAPD
jgi:hypothetical protein